ncbi:MAG: rod shape-determining protein RodA [Breznakibacter sp.]|nr:rod shape-determining protein RodA [Breznakibacter sp.]
MARDSKLFGNVDWITITIYLLMVLFGWLNIYAANYTPDNPVFFDSSREYAKQLIWILFSFGLIWLIMMSDSKAYVAFAYLFYAFTLLLLVAVLAFGRKVNGAQSWFEIGAFRFQPSELTKVGTNLVIAHAMSRFGFSWNKMSDLLKLMAIWLVPPVLILLQNDTGSALVYGVFLLVFYREGMSAYILLFVGLSAFVAILALLLPLVALVVIIIAVTFFVLWQKGAKKPIQFTALALFISLLLVQIYHLITDMVVEWDFVVLALMIPIAIYFFIYSFVKRSSLTAYGMLVLIGFVAFSYSVEYMVNHVLSDHQRTRIQVMLGQKNDPKGVEYNVIQSKIAIGSGGFAGKGFLEGTQTKFNFVPEQSTDFIFCTVGEEWGFIGSVAVLALFVGLIIRILFLAEKQRSAFSRIYGYGVASILFFHFAVNIGMTIGLVPVIGIPLPFFSYGGSSLWAFTILLFIFVKLDSNRTESIH